MLTPTRTVDELTVTDINRLITAVHRRFYKTTMVTRDDCADAVGDAILAAVRVGAPFDDLGRWLFVVAYRRIRSHCRSHRVKLNTSIDSLPESTVEAWLAAACVDPLNGCVRRDDMRKLVAHMRTLPRLQRNALVLFTLSDMGWRDIAARLDVSEGAAKVAASRGRHALRAHVAADQHFHIAA